MCLWEGNYFFCSNYDSRHVCQISLANSQYSASNEPLNIWPDSLLFELWRADSDHVMCNIIILFDVKSITSLTADPTAHVRVVYNSDWIWWIKSIKCRLLLILEEEIIPDNQNENSRVRKLWNDQVPKTKMNYSTLSSQKIVPRHEKPTSRTDYCRIRLSLHVCQHEVINFLDQEILKLH